MTLLSIDNLEASYENTPILHGVSFSINKDEIAAVIGRNGVGKTTLMRAIIGELHSTGGQIHFAGSNITDKPSHLRAQMGIGYVPQNKNVFPRLSVEKNLEIGTYINKNKRKPLHETVYNYFPILEERKNQDAGTMSGGEQQMLAIARALIGDPDLLLLDEPSEGVQPSIVTDIRKKISKINNDLDMAILFVEQNMEFTQKLAESCYVMEKGEFVDSLSVSELQDSDTVSKYLSI